MNWQRIRYKHRWTDWANVCWLASAAISQPSLVRRVIRRSLVRDAKQIAVIRVSFYVLFERKMGTL